MAGTETTGAALKEPGANEIESNRPCVSEFQANRQPMPTFEGRLGAASFAMHERGFADVNCLP
jgi:hypothetical protein